MAFKESDLFNPVKFWLLNYKDCTDVFAEVLDIDVVGFNKSLPFTIAIELKKNFSFKLLEQATDRLEYAQYVYIAIPLPKRHFPPRFISNYCREKGIGILYVDLGSKYIMESVIVNQEAKYNHQVFKNIKKVIEMNRKIRIGDFSCKEGLATYSLKHRVKPYNHFEIGGVSGNNHSKITPYKITIMRIKRFLKQNGWSTLKDVVENVHTHYSNPKAGIYGALRFIQNQDWVCVRHGKHGLEYNVKNISGNEFHEIVDYLKLIDDENKNNLYSRNEDE